HRPAAAVPATGARSRRAARDAQAARRTGACRVIAREPYSYRHDPTVPSFPDDRPIMIFDGYCALCSASANFMLRHDHRAVYPLLRAQSPLGPALYLHSGIDPQVEYETNILIEDGRAWFRSESSIRLLEGLGWPWRLAAIFRILPLFIRDPMYDLIARNRFRFFGRRDTCYLPQQRYHDRFLA